MNDGRAIAQTAALVAVGALGVALTRGPIVSMHEHAREANDVYVLPPPAELVPMSLGFRAALADVLWASVLVSQGLHMQAKRRYETVVDYLDAVNALDPTFRDPYVMADTLITFQVGNPSHDEILKAREIMERGTRALPLDAEIWLDLGGFVGYVAPGTYLTDPAEQARWRLDGARFLARAAELAGDNAGISLQALGGAGILNKAGDRAATLKFYQRACPVIDDPDVKRECQAKLDSLLGTELADQEKRLWRAFESSWRADVPFATMTAILLLGPPRDPRYCAGGVHDDEPRCAGTWLEWHEKSRATSK